MEIGRVDNVAALFQMDKANIEYEEIESHNFTVEQLRANKELCYGDDYYIFDNVPVIGMSKSGLQSLALKLADLSAEALGLQDIILKDGKTKTVCSGIFIVSDNRKCLLVATFGYSYPRFKAFVGAKTSLAVKAMLKLKKTA